MSKLMQVFLAAVVITGFAGGALAGVSLDVMTYVNSAGNDVYIVSATSDEQPISSLGIKVVGDGNLAQYHPAGFNTWNQDYNAFFGPTPIDYDTQAMFATGISGCIICLGTDTPDMLETNFTGFEPFISRDVVQIVLTGGDAMATIDVVSDGVQYTLYPQTTYGQTSILNWPEPASMTMLAIGAATIIRRR